MINTINMVNMVNLVALQVTPFICITILFFGLIMAFSVKVVGPIAPIPENKGRNGNKGSNENNDDNDWARGTGIAAFQFIFGGAVLLLEIKTLITLLPKLKINPLYLIDSNQLLFTLVIFMICFYMIGEIFIAPSKWHLFFIISGTIIAIVSFTLYLEFGQYGDEFDYLLVTIEILIGLAFCYGLINIIGKKKFMRNNPSLFRPVYIMPKNISRLLSLPKMSGIMVVIAGLFFWLSWTDIPLF